MYHYIWEHPYWPNFRWQSDKLLMLLGECRLAQGKLLSKVAELGFSIEQQAQAEILAEETLKTAAIEGEILDMRTVRSSVARILGLPSAGLPVDRHVEGLVSVLFDATQNYDNPLMEERLCGWQAALFPTGYSGMHKLKVGEWRGDKPMRVVSGPVGRETVHFEAPPADGIAVEIRRFLDWWEESRSNTEGLIRAAIAHFWFVTIHPFEDGNGRIARALTDMALSQDDRQRVRYYSLSSQIMSEREVYYNVLEHCQKRDVEITEWLVWFLGCFSRAVQRSERLLSAVLGKAAFWKRHIEAPLSERQRKVINRMLDAGKGSFEGGLTTRKYVSLANVSRTTAFRELEQLLGLGIIKQNPGRGRSVSYDLKWPEDN